MTRLATTSLTAIRLRLAWTGVVAVGYEMLARVGLLQPRVRHATGYWRKGVTYIHPLDGLSVGGHRARPPAVKFAADAPPSAIGAAIHEALADYRIWVLAPHARSEAYKSWWQTYLQALDARTNAEMMKGGKLVSISLDDRVIRFEPWRNEGARRGFTGMPPDAVVELPADVSPEGLGKALAEAFARCG